MQEPIVLGGSWVLFFEWRSRFAFLYEILRMAEKEMKPLAWYCNG